MAVKKQTVTDFMGKENHSTETKSSHSGIAQLSFCKVLNKLRSVTILFFQRRQRSSLEESPSSMVVAIAVVMAANCLLKKSQLSHQNEHGHFLTTFI